MTAIPRTRLSKDGEEEAGPSSASMDLGDYLRKIEPTDRLPSAELRPVLMSLFGEVGGILATLKKRVRERESYPEYDEVVEEEVGDALWYFAALCRRLRTRMDSIVVRPPTTAEDGDPGTWRNAVGAGLGNRRASSYQPFRRASR